MASDAEVEQGLASVMQLAAAMSALGLYTGGNTAAEHAEEAAWMGGEDAYRVRLANALLGAAQTQAMLADAVSVSGDALVAAHEQQFLTAGVAADPAQRIAFLHWQTLRVGGPLREIAQNVDVGPIPLAAAHAVAGLQQLLGVIADSQGPTPDDVECLAGPVTDELRAAREALAHAINNIDDVLLDL